MSETKAAFAELSLRSLKNILYRNMEVYECKYIQTIPRFIATMNSGTNSSIGMKLNHVKDSDFMSLLYSKPLREYRKPKYGIGDSVRISKYDLPFRKGYKPQFTQNILKSLPLLLKKLQYIQSKTYKKKLHAGDFKRRK